MQTLSHNSLVKQVKEANQDFEFYPTTAKIANVIYMHLAKYSSVLDIGAGNGTFFRLIEEIDNKHKECEERYSLRMGDKYAIEKSKVLIDNMDKDIALVGSDFYNQTLIDKKVDCVFCNPPYSACEEWATKIIREANTKQAFIVMPITKWDKSKPVKEAIKAREATFECLLKYDYNESEFRKARTIVGVYKISLCHESTYGRNEEANIDPFDLWFDENFKFSEAEKKESFSERVKEQEKESLVTGRNLIERLELMYNEDLNKTQNVYKAIAQTPIEVLKELGIEKETISKALKMKIRDTKNLYWQELFKNLDVITRKLTNASRRKISEKLTSSTNIDFSASNAYAVVCWVLKNANSYFDKQLIEVYKNLTRAKNVKPYKSNQRFNDYNFRYNRCDGLDNYKLDYRIILSGQSHCLTNPYSGREVELNDYHNQYTFSQVQDIFTVASNLGFEYAGQYHGFPVSGWKYGKTRDLHMKNGEILASIKIYKNGNYHFKFSTQFMKAFNVEAGRLLGWLKSPQQAADELKIKPEECLKFFKSNLSLERSHVKLLACDTPTEAAPKKESGQAKFNFM